jgi:hypothetical protein
MAKTLQFRRGTTSELNTQSGAVGELFVDTTKDTVVVMDGSTAGGFPLQRELVSGTTIKTVNGESIIGSGNIVISGSGESFNQDLNTTDDVVFNSALVGDVSIIGNEISATDAYGNNSELLINAPLTVNAGGTSSNTVLFTNTLTSAGWFFQGSGTSTISITDTRQIPKELFTALNPGDTFTLLNNSTNLPLTYTFVSLVAEGSQLTITVEEYNNGGNITFGQNYLELNYSVNTLVNVLEVTESGINVNGALTVNGQPVAGGSGSSYDQSLNTTDDVVFNSALIGDVSIVGNQISATDAYGNEDTLVVDGGLTVSAGTVAVEQTIANTITPAAIEGPGGDDHIEISIARGFSLEDVQKIASIPPGTVVNMTNIFVPSQNWSAATGYFEVWQIQNITPNSCKIKTESFVLDGYGNLQGSYLGTGITSSEWSWSQTVTVDVPFNALVTDASGVAVQGALTVNGLPVNVTSYDQDLNSTDDVVFNSALIGDVSIVGNEISGVDSYGNAEELTVAGGLIVQIDKTVVNTGSVNLVEPNTYQWGPFAGSFGGLPLTGLSDENISKLSSLVTGTVVQYNNLGVTGYGNYSGTFTVGGAGLSGNTFFLYINYMGFLPELGSTIYSPLEFSNIDFTWIGQTTTGGIVDALSVTETGVNVEGTFTVNGQPVSGGSSSSFDQDLNTTDDVVFNSALIGDVSIVGNQISGVDSYGNADTLVVDGELDVKINNTVATTTNIVQGQDFDYIYWQNFVQGSPEGVFNIYGPLSSEFTRQIADLVGKTINVSITLQYTDPGPHSGLVFVDNVQVNPNIQGLVINYTALSGNILSLQSAAISGDSTIAATISLDTITSVVNTPLSVTETGVNVEGTLTTPTLLATDALIGDVSIVGNTISGVDSYGLADTLVVDGDLEVTGSIINDSTLTVNQDGSKSVVVDTTSTTTTTLDLSGYGQIEWVLDNNNGRYYFAIPTSLYELYGEYFTAGTVVTGFFDAAGKAGPFTLTLATDMVSRVISMTKYAAETVEIPPGFPPNSTNSIWSNEVTVTNTSGTIVDYSFDDQGTFTSDSLLADSALIGDVSIAGNTIAAVDSYGLASELAISASSVLFDQDLNLSVDSTVGVVESVFGGMNQFYVYGPMQGNVFSYNSMGSTWSDSSKFVTGTIVSVNDPMDGNVVIQLTSNMTYSMGAGGFAATYTVISGGINLNMISYNANTVTVTNTTGSIADYSFDDQGTFTSTSVISDSALIGDVSIIGNEIAVEDSYGLPGTLNVSASEVVIKSNLDLTVDSRNSTTETVTDTANIAQFTVRPGNPGTPQLTYSPNEGSSWASAYKFVTGSIVSITDPMYGTKVIRLTSDMTYDNMDNRWEAGYTTISEGMAGSNSDYRSYSVIVTNESGAVANYGFDDQGVFTTPTISTNNLLVAGSPAGLLTINEDGSKSVLVDTVVETTETIPNTGINFTVTGAGKDTPRFTYASMDPNWVYSPKFVTGTVVSFTDSMWGAITIQLTTDMVYSNSFMRWQADYILVSGGQDVFYSSYNTYSPTITNTSGSAASYSFDQQGTFTAPALVADSALIGDVSIIDNQIAVEDSYGLPGTLAVSASDVVFDSNLNLGINSLVETTETISGSPGSFRINAGNPGTPTFSYSPMGTGTPFDVTKFKVGTIVTVFSSLYGGAVVARLTSPLTFDNVDMRWEATYTLISAYPNFSAGGDVTVSSVTITNTIGATSDYSFDDQGVFTAPTVSTDNLLVDGSPAGLLEINSDNSKSVVIDTFVSNTETVTAGGASSFYLSSTYFRYSAPSGWTDYTKFLKDAIVTISYAGQTSVIKLTSDMSYQAGEWIAYYIVISNSADISKGVGPVSSVTVTTESGKTVNYDFTESGFVAEAALIGNVSIIDNEIAVEDSYGVPGTLNVSASDIVIKSNLDLTIDSRESTTETVTDVGNMSQFTVRTGNPGVPQLTYSPMSGSGWPDASKFVTGSIVSITDSMYGTKVIRLTSDMTFDNIMDYRWEAGYTTISENAMYSSSEYRSYSVVVTNESGGVANYGFDDQGTFTSSSIVADSALIGDVSIVGNQIAVEDSYGLPGTLAVSAANVVVNSNLNLDVDTNVSTTETVSGGGNTFGVNSGKFVHSNMMGSSWADAFKFITGTQVSIKDYMSQQTVVIELTSDFTFDNMDMRWEANYTVVSGSDSNNQSTSVIITNTTGDLASYSFDDQGTFTSPTVSTNNLLLNGLPPGFLTTNEDGSKSVVVDSFVENTETINAGMGQFRLNYYTNPQVLDVPTPDSVLPFDTSKFVTGTQVTLTDPNYGTFVVELTQDLNKPSNRWQATFNFISGSENFSADAYASSVSITNTTGSIQNYEFGSEGTFTSSSIVADSALIGDVSIAANTITATDSYGLADTLVVNGGLEVQAEGETTINSYDSSDGLTWGALAASSSQGTIRIESYGSMNLFTEELLSSIPTGARVTIRSMTQSLSTYTVVNVTVVASMGGDAYVIAVEEPVVNEGPYDTFITIESTPIVTPLQVTGSGIAVEGALSVDTISSTNLTLAIGTLSSGGPVTETINAGMGQFRLNYYTTPYVLDVPTPDSVLPFDTSKFVTGTQVTLVDPTYGEFVVELTQDLYKPSSIWRATFNFISGEPNFSADVYVGSVSITYIAAGGGLSNYTFADDGLLTLPSGGSVSYTPADDADWSSPPPTTIHEAIDRLAVLVKSLNTGTGA